MINFSLVIPFYNEEKNIPFVIKSLNRVLKIYKQIFLRKFKLASLYIAGLFIASSLIYLSIPIFFNYDKLQIDKAFCNDLKICLQIKDY